MTELDPNLPRELRERISKMCQAPQEFGLDPETMMAEIRKLIEEHDRAVLALTPSDEAIFLELTALEAGATAGPWRVESVSYPTFKNIELHEHRIITDWDHPQAKGPLTVNGVAVGLGETEHGAPRHLLWMKKADADLIVAIRNALPRLLQILTETVKNESNRHG